MDTVKFGGVEYIWESPQAMRVRLDDGADGRLSTETWVPKSCIMKGSTVSKKSSPGDLVVPTWFAKRKGWV